MTRVCSRELVNMANFTLLLVAMVGSISVVVRGEVFPAYTQCCDCDTMEPFNPPADTQPQLLPSPYKIVTDRIEYRPGEEVRVNLTAKKGTFFRDFMIKAVKLPLDKKSYEPKESLGRFAMISDNVGAIQDCPSTKGKAFKSSLLQSVNLVKVGWTADEYYGHIHFLATFIVTDDVYWVAEKSRPIIDPTAIPLPIPTEPPHLIPPISVAECGLSKGCFREPAGCWEPYCRYIVTWKSERRNGVSTIRFEIGGSADGLDDRYVAVGLSHDTYMGDDSVLECVHNSVTGETNVFLSYNEGNSNQRLSNPTVDIVDQEGSFHDGRPRCRVWMRKIPNQRASSLFPLVGEASHLLLAHGVAVNGNIRRHGLTVGQFPIVSPSKINFQTTDDLSGRASYPLVKAHACLMILAWVFFASIGLLMTKYYKPMWPNRRFFEQKYWFVAHFNCMSMVFLLVIIAFILIFIEAGGYSQAPDLPQKAHPILGIIIFVCIIINPILALIRPSEDNKCRPVFNWFHWAFGTIANVLAIPQIFIGLDFGKPHVPWWATWILVIWVIFHLVVELTLEVHQCCTHKKNKERRKKWEMQKHENPKLHIPEPEPAGRRFKRFMLFLHLIVTSIITLIMIIVIAVA